MPKIKEVKSEKGLFGSKLNPFDKVRKRPEPYVGVIENVEKEEWVFDDETQTIIKRSISYNTGILHLFVEIMSNAIDNLWRSTAKGYTQTSIWVTVDADSSSEEFGWISVKNDGYPIPVELHEYSLTNYRTGETTTDMAYPADYFWGEFDSGTNYEEDENRKSSGLNGIGGKIVTALSTKVIIDHADPNNHKKYYKIYEEGGKVQHDPVISGFQNKNGYTSVSFLPDFEYFEVEGLTDDFYALLKRYVYEAAMITGLKVYLNGEKAVVSNLEKFSRFFYPDAKANKSVHFQAPNGDECVLIAGDFPETNTAKAPAQVSWINGISTSEGGIHVDAWKKAIFPKIVKAFNTKKRGPNVPELKVTAERIYPWLMLYVRAETLGANFESNSKKKLTYIKSLDENGVSQRLTTINLNTPPTKAFTASLDVAVEKIMKWDFISIIEEQLLAEMDVKNAKDVTKGVVKFMEDKYKDANLVNEEPESCILLICEGSSAHTMARTLIPHLPGGRDYWGAFELRGKFVNLCKAKLNKILKNEEFRLLKRMTGLVPLADYSTLESREGLRYGGFWLMTDSDPDGFHIKGLVSSSLNKFWPTIIPKDPELSMVSDFATYVLTISVDGKFIRGYNSLPAFEADTTPIPAKAEVRYLKGLGSHEPSDTLAYAKNIKVRKFYKDDESTALVYQAFEAPPAARKEWLLNVLRSNREIRPARIVGDVPLSEFVNNDVIPFFVMTLNRALPSIWDGFKDAQRKCVFGMENQKFPAIGKTAVSTVAGAIKELTEYHHGELYETIARLAQNFAGSNNINYFYPSGSFGTRQFNGQDIAKERYLATRPEDVCKAIFLKEDRPLLERLTGDDRVTKLEYHHFAPVVPMILINGAEGIATGWSTYVPCYNPADIVQWIRDWLADKTPAKALKPWYRGFRGEITLMAKEGSRLVPWQEGSSTPPVAWISKGILTKDTESWAAKSKSGKKATDEEGKAKGKWANKKGWVISEIPIGISFGTVLKHINFLLTGVKQMSEKAAKNKEAKAKTKTKAKKGQVTAKITPKLRDVKDYSLNNYPEIKILPKDNFTPDMDTKGNFDILIKKHSLTNMILLNADGIPTKYDSPEAILREWCDLRFEVYSRRRVWWIKRWGHDLLRSEQRYKYVKAVIDGELDMHQQDEALERSMIKLGLVKLVPDSKWKAAEDALDAESEKGVDGDEDIEGEKEDSNGTFDYLLSMQMRSMTVKKLEEIKKEMDKIQAKIDDYEQATEEVLWERDLVVFENAYEKHYEAIKKRDESERKAEIKNQGKVKGKGKKK